MTMRAFVFDYECYFDRASKYTLEHMNPAEYILDDRFEVTGLAVKELGCPAQWIEGPDVGAFLASLDPDDTTTIGHNLLFDASVSSYRYGFVPKLMVCMRVPADRDHDFQEHRDHPFQSIVITVSSRS